MTLNYPISANSDKKLLKNSALGIYTKSHATRSYKAFSASSVDLTRPHDYILQDRAGELLPNERVKKCMKCKTKGASNVILTHNAKMGKTNYSNVQRCGSVWTCLVCAKKISEARREHLKKGIDAWTSSGNQVLLLTLTASHHYTTDLKQLLNSMNSALKAFWGNRKGVELLSDIGRKHHIRALEITFGENGWHPHFHILLFVDNENLSNQHFNHVYLKDFKIEFAKHWQNVTFKRGLTASLNHGCDIRDGTYAEQYVSKWGLDCEMTKQQIKKGRGSFTPFDLLNLSLENNPVFHGRLPSKLFQEYAQVFKGQRQLCFSKGLSQLIKLDDKSDEELANEVETKDAVGIFRIPDLIFKLIKKHKQRHIFAEVATSDYLKIDPNITDIDQITEIIRNNKDSSTNLFLNELYLKEMV